jgi:hypothetical protein
MCTMIAPPILLYICEIDFLRIQQFNLDNHELCQCVNGNIRHV